MKLADQVAIVTGAGGGIGSAIVRALAAEGAAVVANDYGVTVDGQSPSSAAAETIVQEVVAQGGRATPHFGSVADYDVARDLVEVAIATYGRLDILVTPHGILRERMVFNMTADEWNDVVDVHLTGTFNCVRFASAHMRRQGSGTMVLVTSIAGLGGSAGQANYAAAKAGIVGLTYSTALAMGKYNVSVNALAPTAATRMTGRLRSEYHGSGERPDASTAAAVAVALCCPEARAITGQVFGGSGARIARWSHPAEVELAFRDDGWTVSDVLRTLTTDFSAPPLARFERQNLQLPGGPSPEEQADG